MTRISSSHKTPKYSVRPNLVRGRRSRSNQGYGFQVKAKTAKTTTKAPLRGKPQRASERGIGARIAFVRRQRAISLEELEQKSWLTKSFLSKLERGLSVPSISPTMSLAESFGLTVGQLMGEQQYDDAICIVRNARAIAGPSCGAAARSATTTTCSPPASGFKPMEPHIIRPPLAFQNDRWFQHTGQEFLFALSGSLEVEFAGKFTRLDAGDAVFFDSNSPHRSRSLKGRMAEALASARAKPPSAARQTRSAQNSNFAPGSSLASASRQVPSPYRLRLKRLHARRAGRAPWRVGANPRRCAAGVYAFPPARPSPLGLSRHAGQSR
jgi:mannose-6-phosphate isomerase-like protein (cupin superfamily)/ribosome-binding protein aMBF1 (putative translation factor)